MHCFLCQKKNPMSSKIAPPNHWSPLDNALLPRAVVLWRYHTGRLIPMAITILCIFSSLYADNLLRNPGFEEETGWGHRVWKGQYEAVIDGNERHTGGRSAKIESTGETGNSFFFSDPVKVKENRTYRLSVYVKANHVDDAGIELWKVIGRFRKGSYDWEKYEFEIQIPPGKMEVIVRPFNRGTGTIWFDDFSVEEIVTPQADPEALAAGAKNAFSNIEKQLDALANQLKQAEDKAVEVPYQKVSLTVGRLFKGFIGDDIREGRLELAVRELEQLQALLTRAITETAAIIADPSTQLKLTPSCNSSMVDNLKIKDGVIYSGSTPIFLAGAMGAEPELSYYHPLDKQKAQDTLRVAKSLEMNLIRVGDRWGRRIMPEMGKFDDRKFSQAYLPAFQLAQENGFLVDIYLSNAATPDSVAKLDPEAAKSFGTGVPYDLEHPLGKTYTQEMFAYLGKQFTRQPNVFCYLLEGEEFLNGVSKRTGPLYANWLRKKYADIEQLNKIWNARYPSFEEAAKDNMLVQDKTNRATFYDWHEFNQYRLTAFFQNQIDLVRREDPNAVFSRYTSNEPFMYKAGDWHLRGVDREAAVNMCEVSGCDTRPGYFDPSLYGMAEEHYILAWLSQSLGFDFMKSVKPGNPIYDGEWGGIKQIVTRDLHVPAAYMRTVLWLAHCHGMGAHEVYSWNRGDDRYRRHNYWSLGYGFLGQPQILDAWARTMLELRRLIEQVVKFPQQERRVKMLYSEASAIQESTFLDAMCKVYEALYFLDYPVGFATENQVKTGILQDCALLVVPNAKYIKAKTFEEIQKYQGAGGRVIFVGADSLKYDEHGYERDRSSVFSRARTLSLSLPVKDLALQFDQVIDQAKIDRPARLLDEGSRNAPGVEMRCINEPKRKLFYIINLNKHPVRIQLSPGKTYQSIRELTQNRNLKPDEEILCEPMNPMLMEATK